MSKEDGITRKQHYVPCCVLKYFKESDDVFNRKKKRICHVIHNRNKIYPSTIDDVMSGKFFYEHSHLKKNQIEKKLNKFESLYSVRHGQVVKLIEEYEERNVKFSDVKAQIFGIIEDMIRMYLRSGAIMFELNYWREKGQPNYSLFRMLNRLFERNYTLAFANTLIKFHDFCILKSNNKNFVISDQFLSTASLSFKARFMNATNRTIGLKDVIIFIPLSKSYYLCFYNGSKPYYIRANQFNKLTLEQTEAINGVIMNNSYMQTAGPTFESLNKALDYYEDSGPTAVYYGGGKARGGAELRKEVFYYERDKSVYDFIVGIDYPRFNKVTKNELCPCGSGKLYGSCCRFKVREFEKFMERLEQQRKNKNFDPYRIDNCDFHEENIFEYHTRINSVRDV